MDSHKNHPAEPLWLLMGASGRVGRMLMRHWTAKPPSELRILPQLRNQGDWRGDCLIWAPLDGPKPLINLANSHGSIAGLIVLSGVTPATGPNLQDNEALVQAAIAAAKVAGISRLLLASSSAVYGHGGGFPQTEAAKTLPVNDYGRAKLAAEQIADKARGSDLAITTLRIGNVAGADVLLLNGARATKQLPLRLDCFADGAGPKRSYIGPETLAAVIETLARHQGPLPHILNIGAPRQVSMEALVGAADMPWQFVPAPPTAFQNIALDCKQLSELHRFLPAASDPVAMVDEWRRLKDPV